jgi:hypothetical protein
MAAVSRRKFCANLKVYLPQEVQWKPPLRQAAGTLCVSGESVVEKCAVSKKLHSKDCFSEKTITFAA